MAKNTVGKPLSEKYREFFQPIVHTMTKTHKFPHSSTPEDENYRNFRTGHSGIVYGANFHGVTFRKGVCVAVCVFIARYGKNNEEWNKQLFDQLEGRKESIESRLGFGKLDWARLDGSDGGKHSKACRISALRDGTIDDDPKTLDDIRGWMIERLVAFKEVFGPELDRLLR